jgi:hypothetical protein
MVGEKLSRLSISRLEYQLKQDTKEVMRVWNPSKRPPTPGTAFLKWLLVNQCNPQFGSTIDLTPKDPER